MEPERRGFGYWSFEIEREHNDSFSTECEHVLTELTCGGTKEPHFLLNVDRHGFCEKGMLLGNRFRHRRRCNISSCKLFEFSI